jgi:hypothetical protein
MSHRFPTAPWPTFLKVMSLLGTLVLAGASDAAYRVIPTPTGFTHDFGLVLAILPLALLTGSLFFSVSGDRLEPARLSIRRRVTSTSIPLTDLQRVWMEPTVCQGSVRIVGHGGPYAVSGWFYRRPGSSSGRPSIRSRLPRRVSALPGCAPWCVAPAAYRPPCKGSST